MAAINHTQAIAAIQHLFISLLLVVGEDRNMYESAAGVKAE
jgi:hypothetical protein